MTPRSIDRRLSRVLRDITDGDREAGRAWYREARATAADIASESGVTFEQAAGIVAAWSPRCQWADNQRRARRCANGEHVAGLSASRRSAERIRAGEPPLAVLRGPKTRAFFLNIIGDDDAVTVDVWAARAAGVDAESLTPRRYAIVADAYRRAARRHGLTPAEAQAAVWIHVRGRAA